MSVPTMTLFCPSRFTHVQGILHAMLCAVLVISGGCGSAVAQTAGRPSNFLPEVKIGVLANRGSSQCLAAWGLTADYLTAHVPGRRFKIVPLGYADAEPAILARQIDFIFVNSSQYVVLESQYQISQIATLKNKVDGELVSRYGSVIFCRADRRDITSLNDLRGKSFMAPDEDSFGGWQMTLRELRQKGIDPEHDFSNVHFGGNQDAVVRAVLQGDVDAGTIRTGVVEPMVVEGKIRREDFHVLSAYDGARSAEAPRLISTRSYPEWPLARLQHTPLALAEQVAEALRKMPAEAPAAQKADIAGWTYPADYGDVRECLKELQIGPFRTAPAVTLVATVRAYWPWLLGALLATAGLAMTTAMFARMNGRLAVSQKVACTELAQRRAAEQRLAAAAEALHNRGEWLNTIVNASADGMIAIDEYGMITLFNQAAERIFGWNSGEMLGHPLECLMPEEFRETHRQHLRSYFATGRPNAAIGQALELTGLRKDGQPVPLELSIAASHAAEKKLVVAVFRNISARKLHEEELRWAKEHAEENAARLRTLTSAVQQSPASVVITDLQGSIKYVNPGFTQTTGYTSEEAIGQNPRVLQSGARPREFYEQMWKTLTRGEIWRGEICNRKKTGELFWEDATIAPVSDDHGVTTHFVAVKIDVTQRKRAVEALTLAKEQAESATRAKSEFLANMSHEIRTPMTAILGYTDILADSVDRPEQQEAVQTIKRNSNHLLGLVNDILDLSKIEAGRIQVEHLRVSPLAILGDVVSLMRVRTEAKKLPLKLEYFGPIPQTIQTDPTRLRQILVNLVGNAIKFTETGGVTIAVRLVDRDTAEPKLQCAVIDTGVGMSPQQLERLFQPFRKPTPRPRGSSGGRAWGWRSANAWPSCSAATSPQAARPARGAPLR